MHNAEINSEIRNQFRIQKSEINLESEFIMQNREFILFVFDQIVYGFGGEVGLKTSCEDVTE